MPKKKPEDHRPFWVLDAETDPFKYGRIPEPFIWGVYTGAGFHTFLKTDDMIDCIKEQDVIVYAHNGGKFDFHLILKYLNLHEEMKIIDGRIVSAHIGKAEVRDSFSLFPAPLKSFAGKLDIDYKKLEKKVRHLHMPEIIEYLRADCVELWHALFEHEQVYGRHLTQASASMALWKKLSGIQPPKTDKGFFEKFSRYYYGGRVECFRKGHINGPIGVWDIRSAYPWAMLSEHPYDPQYQELAYPRRIRSTDMLTVDCISTGALPFRGLKGAITFPRDQERRRFFVPGHEYLAAMETGALRDVEVINAIRFAGQRDFGIYVNHCYDNRKRNRVLAREAASAGDKKLTRYYETQTFFDKRYMTGLYGKFAANPENYGNFMCVPWNEKLGHGEEGYEFNGILGPHALMRKPLDPWQEHYINIATAASITSQVRAHLWRAIDGSDDPIYCDTDCVMARSAPHLPIGEELGQWNREGVAKEAYIAGKKLYYLKGQFEGGKREKMASKGVRPDGKKIRAAAMGHVVETRSDAPTFTLKGNRRVYFQKRKIRMTA